MDCSEHEANYLGYVKIALASVIIRNRPVDSTAKEYTVTLMNMLKDKDLEIEKKINELTNQLFHAKQQDLLKSQMAAQFNGHNEDRTILRKTSELDTSFLTPPPSGSRSITNIQQTKTLQRHCHFLRHISLLCRNQTQSFEEDYISVVMETLKKVIQLMEKGETLINLPEKVLQTCITSVIDTIQLTSMSNYQTDLKAQVLILVEHLVEEMINCTHIEWSQKISKLLVTMGNCHVLCHDVLCCLTSYVCVFSDKLKDVIDGHTTLQSTLKDYENIYHVMWTIEQISTNILHKLPCPPEVKKKLTTLMEDSVLYTSRSFPVFASYIWHIQALFIE